MVAATSTKERVMEKGTIAPYLTRADV